MIGKIIDNIIGLIVYTIMFFGVLRIGFNSEMISTNQLFSISFVLAFFAGEINNLERVIRELFDKNYMK